MKTELYSKPFKKYPSIISFLILPFHPSSIKTSFSFIFTAWKSFVVIQNKQKFHITRKNVVNVEHPLDEKIPFVPSLHKYLLCIFYVPGTAIGIGNKELRKPVKFLIS